MTTLLTYSNTLILVLFLIAGGWVKIRNYFRDKAQAKAEAVEAAAKAKADEIEAAVQERLKKLKEEKTDAPTAAAPSTTGTASV